MDLTNLKTFILFNFFKNVLKLCCVKFRSKLILFGNNWCLKCENSHFVSMIKKNRRPDFTTCTPPS